MCTAAWLSQNTCIGKGIVTESSPSSLSSHTTSPTTCLMALYSASAEDNDTVGCFLDFQLIGLSPSKTKYPLTDLLESGHVAQSESQYALMVQSEFLDK